MYILIKWDEKNKGSTFCVLSLQSDETGAMTGLSFFFRAVTETV